MSLGLKMISIRLPASLIEDYRRLGKLKGASYQPLMRMALTEWLALRARERHPEVVSPEERA